MLPRTRTLRAFPRQRNVNCISRDRKSTRLNSSHSQISYAVFCLKKQALTLDLDHAGAAVAVRPHAFLVAEVRDPDAVVLRGFDEGLVRPADDGPAVQLELNGHPRRLRGAYAVHRSPLRKTGDRPPFSSSFMSHARMAKKMVVCPRFSRNLLREVFHHRKH